MKTFILVLGLISSISCFAQETKELFITQAGCREFNNDKTKIEVWMFLDEKSNVYSPEVNKSARMFLNKDLNSHKKCEELFMIFESGRKAVIEFDSKDKTLVTDFAPVLSPNFSARVFYKNGTAEVKMNLDFVETEN